NTTPFTLYYYFFFSSRRRHTRSTRDWSSDVCSSDLPSSLLPPCTAANQEVSRQSLSARFSRIAAAARGPQSALQAPRSTLRQTRSEERRVGKECRSRW